ncbi:MAG: DUF2339 domain-containing protein [Propionibacteriaceae bacterium]|nr:DUF2339 domain-containing protein [Propionibacteriaceae bacterium]
MYIFLAILFVLVPLVLAIIALVQIASTRRQMTELRMVVYSRLAQTGVSIPQATAPVETMATPAYPNGAVPQPMAPPAPDAVPVQPVQPGPTMSPSGSPYASPPVYAPQAPGVPNAGVPARAPYLSGAPAGAPASSKVFTENFMGRNLLPILAAVLGLIGLIFLGVLVVPYMSDAIKIVLMFLIAIGVGGLGYGLNTKKSTVLTKALIGTGLGGVFVAILVTHLFFHAISDIVAFALLAGWILACMWLAKHVNSLLIAIIAHIGMVASITMAYSGGVTDDKLILLVAYQILATLAIVIGNIVWVSTMYRFGLFASQLMIIISLSFMWFRFTGAGVGFGSTLPTSLIVAAFLIQFLGATAIAYLLFVSCARVKEPASMTMLTATNALMWAVVLFGSVYMVIAKLTATSLDLDSWAIWFRPEATIYAMMALLVLAFLPAVAVTIANSRVTLRPGLEIGTAAPLAAVSVIALLHQMTMSPTYWNMDEPYPVMSWVIVLFAAYLILGLASRSRGLIRLARVLLVIDALLMLSFDYGYMSLTKAWGVWASFVYLAGLVCLALVTFIQLPINERPKYKDYIVGTLFLGFEVSVFAIVVGPSLDIGMGLFVVISALALVALHFVIKPAPAMLYRISQLVIAVITAVVLSVAGWEHYRYADSTVVSTWSDTVSIILGTAAAVILAVIFIDWIRRAATATSSALRTKSVLPSTAVEVMSGIGVTIAIMAIFMPYSWFTARTGLTWGFSFSLVLMVIALVIVGLGLWSRIKPLRLYGLVVVIACVLKLVTLDIGSVSSIIRVVAFLGGAAVCFGVSALYNYTAKHFDKQLAQDIPMSVTNADKLGVG